MSTGLAVLSRDRFLATDFRPDPKQAFRLTAILRAEIVRLPPRKDGELEPLPGFAYPSTELPGVRADGGPMWQIKQWQFDMRNPRHVEERDRLMRWAGDVMWQIDGHFVRSEYFVFYTPNAEDAVSDPSWVWSQGYTLFNGDVIAPPTWNEADAVKSRDDGQPVGGVSKDAAGHDPIDLSLPDRLVPLTPRPLAVGDEVIAQDADGKMYKTTIERVFVTRDGSGRQIHVVETTASVDLFLQKDVLLIERTLEVNDQ